MNRIVLGVAAAVAIGAAAAGWLAWSAEQARAHELAARELAALSFPAYAPQKVVYHVSASGGWFDRAYKDLLRSLKNHVAAVGASKAQLRVVLQGDGVRLLSDAMNDVEMRDAIDTLRADGVRFEVCRNSLAGRGLRPENLYGLKEGDIVQAAVAEVSALESQGFVYLRF